MRTVESYLTLIAELEGDSIEISRLLEQNKRAWDRIEHGAVDPLDWGALGYTIHTLYGVFENYMSRISKFFENDLPPDRWHQALVQKMSLEIADVRPALFDDRSAVRDVVDILKFRHRFRNLYGEDLDPKKCTAVQRSVDGFFARFPELHDSFTASIRALADAI